MKTALALLLAVFCASANAASIVSNQAKVNYDTADGTGIWKMVQTNASGTPVPTPIPADVPQAVSVVFQVTPTAPFPVGLTGAAYAGVTAGSGILTNTDDIEGVLKGATGTSAPIFTKVIGKDGSNIHSDSNPISVTMPAGIYPIYPATPVFMSLAASTSWTWVMVTCTAQPCFVRTWNHGSGTLQWHVDNANVAPSSTFQGISLPAGSDFVDIPTYPGASYKWKTSDSSTTGGLMNFSR